MIRAVERDDPGTGFKTEGERLAADQISRMPLASGSFAGF
jgi:hypothetical protein